MKINVHFLSYLAQFFLEWEMFQKKKIASSIYDSTHAWRDNVF
jgi:hypothetical protein